MMTGLRVILRRVRAFFTSRRSDADLDENIQTHLDLLTDDYVGRGLSAADARAAALREFGGVTQVKEVYREQRGLPAVESVLKDIRFAVRRLQHKPAFTAVAMATIALGIFGPTVTFTMAKAWILDPLPFARPDELIDLRNLNKTSGDTSSVTAADFLDWQRRAAAFDQLAGYRQSDVRVTAVDRAERLRGALVTPNFFHVLGVTAQLGRVFDATEATAAPSRVAVISHAMWREHFRGDPAVIGRSTRLNGQTYIVIGVLPETFQFTLLGRCDVWRPLVFTPEQTVNRRNGVLVGLGRLKPGRSLDDARGELSQIATFLSVSYPETNAYRDVRVWTLAHEIRMHHDLGFIVPVMFAMVGCVLLIACVNVTNVMLAQASTRRQEMAVRLALGASRWRIVRQWLVEHVLLFVTASAVGVALAVYGANWITQSIPIDNRQYLRNYAVLPVDRTVVLFALVTGVFCGVVFGLIPAWSGARADVNADLRDVSARATPGRGGTRLRAWLVVCEVALALAVLINAGLLVTTARNVARVDVGFDSHRLLVFQMGLDAQKYQASADLRGFYDRLTADLRGRPGVLNVAAGSLVPFGDNGDRTELLLEGAPVKTPAETPDALLNQVTGDYADTLRLRLTRGRTLSAADGADTPKVAMISDNLAARHFPNQNPIGKRFRINRDEPDFWTVVGVVADVKHFETIEATEPQVYVPFAQRPRRSMSVVIRTDDVPERLIATARAALANIDPAEPIVDLASMDTRIRRVTGPYQTIATFVLFFGAVTLLLAGVGVYGVTSYAFAQRTREIGIRMAFGAGRPEVVGLVLKQTRTILMSALLPGLLLAWILANALKAMLFRVTPTDWVLYVSMTSLLALVSLVGSFVPARRALAIDPVVALRYE